LLLTGFNDFLAIGNDDGEIILLKDPDTGQQEILFKSADVKFHSLTFSNNGKYLAAGDEEGIVRIWDLSNQSLLTTLGGHNSLIRKIRFSNDDSMLASSGFDGKVILWRMESLNDLPNIFNDHHEYVWSLTFTADGNYLMAGCGNGIIKLWPTQSQMLADKLCNKISRNLNQKEWDSYVGHDIPYENTCSDLAVETNDK
jgi:WD40 repeat protein